MVQFAAALVTTKLSAILLGTVGVGIVNQLTFLTQKMSQFTTLSMVEGVVKQIAENRNNEDAANLIKSAFKSYIVLVSIFLVISITFLSIFANTITNYIFGDLVYLPYFFVGLFTFPLLILGSIPFAMLKGFLDVKTIARARIGIVFVNLLIAVPLIYYFRLKGAIAFVPISYVVDLLFHYFYARRKYFKTYRINFLSIITAPFKMEFVSELFLFSGFGITVGSYAIVSEFTCRAIVVSNLGVDKIGLYSPIIMWASVFTGFLLPSLSTYLYPRFCELKTNREISGLLNDSLRLGTLMIIPLILVGIPFREFVITVFYSKDFIEASNYLPYHFLGIAFYVWWYVFTQAMTPTGRIKQHGLFQLFFLSTDILVTYFSVKLFGLWGWMLKHTISPFIFFWVYLLYSKKNMGFELSWKNLVLMIYLFSGALALILSDKFLISGWLLNYFLGPMMVIISFFLLEKTEKNYLLAKISAINDKFSTFGK